jgi:hypothetical protein
LSELALGVVDEEKADSKQVVSLKEWVSKRLLLKSPYKGLLKRESPENSQIWKC